VQGSASRAFATVRTEGAILLPPDLLQSALQRRQVPRSNGLSRGLPTL